MCETPSTEQFQARHIEALEDQVMDLGIERSRLRARVAELEAFVEAMSRGEFGCHVDVMCQAERILHPKTFPPSTE